MDWMLYVMIGLVVGCAIGWVLAKRGQSAALQQQADSHRQAMEGLQGELQRQQSHFDQSLDQQRQDGAQREAKLEHSLNASRERIEQLTRNSSQLSAELTALKTQLQERQKDLEKTREELTQQFKLMSATLLEQQSTKFTDQNKRQMDGLLGPLKERIASFEKKVEEKYIGETKEREGLRAEIKQLAELNHRLGQEARDLTTALKGDNKAQGNWGELVLTRVLEISGLQEGREFELQHSERDAENRLKQPDVIIKLPDSKHLIIDSKVSLVAYDEYVNAETDELRSAAVKRHIDSVRTHVKGLSAKDYPALNGLNAPDMVLLFIPIEASFAVALEQDTQLLDFAWKNKIVIVTPSTLLATLRTVQSVWQHERQIENASAIADEAGRMLNKFIGLSEDLEKLGNQLFGTAKNTYEKAMVKLTGKGSLIKQARNLQEKGVRTKSEISPTLLNAANSEERDAD